MRGFIILIIAFCHYQAIGQTDISGLLDRLSQKKDIVDPIDRDSQLIWQYNYITEELSRTQDFRSERYLDTLRDLSESSTWPSAKAFYHRAKGRFHDFRGEFTEAMVNYDQALGFYSTANGKLKEYAFTYVLKAFLLNHAEYYEDCKAVIREGLPIARAAKGKNSLCLMLDWFGDYHYYGLDGLVNNDSALHYYLLVNEILPQISYKRIIADNYSVLSGVYGRKENFELQEYYFFKADSILSESNLPFVKWGLYAEKARSLERQQRFQEANELYISVTDFMRTTPNKEFKARYYESLYKNYKALNNSDSALMCLEKYMELEGEMDRIELKKKYDELETQYEVAEKDISLSKLRRERGTLIIILLSIGLLGVLGFGLYMSIKNRQVNSVNKALERANRSVQESFVKGELSERRRIASDLHDNVNTKVAATKWRLEAAVDQGSPGKSNEILESVVLMMDEIYKDVRNVAHNLAPSRLIENGLKACIEEMIYRLNESERTKFSLTVGEYLESDIQHKVYQLYNIIFELINNIVKHSQAESAHIYLDVKSRVLDIKVKDDGVGFDVTNIAEGLGLMSIKDRVKSLNGSIEWESDASGTEVYIKVPLDT